MTAEERAKMLRLVERIQVEKDHDKFLRLIEELNALIAQKRHRLEESEKGPQTDDSCGTQKPTTNVT